MSLYIDADACPVKAEAIRVALRHNAKVFVVCNGGLRPDPNPNVEVVVVPDGPDEADKWIADRTGPGDICVTGDLPLAAKCLEGGAAALSHTGEVFTLTNIGPKLATRDLMYDLRASDPFMQGKGRPFSKADRSAFLNALDRLMVQVR